jgi:VanZ family protein
MTMGLATRKAWMIMSLAWAAMIFELSRAPYSSAASARLISEALAWLRLSMLSNNCGLVNVLLRKSAHLTEYAGFAVLLYNSVKPAGGPAWSPKAAWWALVMAGSYSLTDEWHQSFVPGRHALLSDCVLDAGGALVGLWLLSRRLSQAQRKNHAREESVAEG